MLCWTCTKNLRKLLTEVADDLIPELGVQISRQSVGEKSPGGGGDEAPILFDARASEVLDLVLETAASWVPENAPGIGSLSVSLSRLSKARLLVGWLAHHVVLVARSEGAEKAFSEWGHVRAQIRWVIDRKPARTVLGTCSCGRPIVADARAVTRRCACGLIYDVQANRADLIHLGRKQPVTPRQAEELGEIAPGVMLKASTIRTWAHRKRITPDDQGRYLLGDLLDQALGGTRRSSDDPAPRPASTESRPG